MNLEEKTLEKAKRSQSFPEHTLILCRKVVTNPLYYGLSEHTLILCRTVVRNPLYYGLSGYANHLPRQNYYYL